MKVWWVVEVKPGGGVVTGQMFSDRKRAIANCDTDECALIELDVVAVAHRFDDVDAAAARMDTHPHVSLLCSLQAGREHPPCSGTCDGGGTGEECQEPCICPCHDGQPLLYHRWWECPACGAYENVGVTTVRAEYAAFRKHADGCAAYQAKQAAGWLQPPAPPPGT